MNLFQAIYCNQYEELLRTGRDAGKAHKNGIVIITVAIVINFFTVALILVLMGKGSSFSPFVHRVAEGAGSGRAAGRLIAAVMLLLVGAGVWGTFGKRSYYQRTIEAFSSMGEGDQKRVAKRGAAYFLGSIGIFILLLMASLFIHR